MGARSVAHQLAGRIVAAIAMVRLGPIDDSGAQQLAQTQIKTGAPAGVGEVMDQVLRLGEYGFWSCPPIGGEAIVVYLGGRRSSGLIIATGDRATRPKNLAPGEAMFGNPGQNVFIKATKDGDFVSQAASWTHTGDVHVTGTVFADHMKPADGWTGTYATGDGRTVHVENGITTNVA
jgi:phage gp45-like